MNDSDKIIHKIHWKWMIQIIEDEWFRLSTRFIENEWLMIIEDEWIRLLRLFMRFIEDGWLRLSTRFIENEWSMIIEDEWFRLLKMNNSYYWDYSQDLLKMNDQDYP
jgi:hypothetical protein